MIRKTATKVDVMQDLITTLRTEMERQGVSISALASQAGVGRPYLHRVLAGEQTPNVEWVQKVLDVLNCRITFAEKK